MKTMLRSAAWLAVLTLGAAAASFDDPITLRWKLAKGESLRYRMTQEQTIESEMMGEIENASAFVFHQDVTDVGADGTATMEFVYEAVRLENGGPMPMHYDSTLTGDAAKRNDARLAKIMEPMLAAKLGMKLESTGRVAELTGVTAMLEKAFPSSGTPNPMDPTTMLKEVFNEDSLRKLVEAAVFPTEPITAGHKWSRVVDQKIPMFGTLKLAFENTLVGVEDHAGSRCAKIGITGTMTLEPATEQALPMKISLEAPTISGTLYFGVESGRLVELQIDTTMDMHLEGGGESGQTFEMDMAITTVQHTVLIGKDAPYFE